MKRSASISLSVAAIYIAFLSTQLIHAQSSQSMNSMATADPPSASIQDATEMVPAQATLAQSLDARRIQAGQPVQATLNQAVQLKNGPEMPRGTVLLGTVVNDQKQANGEPELALRFTGAQLKDGQTVPIKATIVGLSAPAFVQTGMTPDPPVNTWNSRTVQVDQIGALPGVDLHSSIGSTDSGVFVATSKDDFKVQRSSRLSLAIAARGND